MEATKALPFTDPASFEDVELPSSSEPLPPLSLVEIVAYFTSDKIIDYVAMTDFFLTFRMFTDTSQVLELLFTRLARAIDYAAEFPDSEMGRDIGVRTFVVLRHWVLNYFPDDFLPDIGLRQRFAYMVNILYNVPTVQSNPAFLNIFHQLKRCWISELSEYWDLGDSAALLKDLTQPTHAGGAFGSRQFGVDTRAIEQRRLKLLSFYKGPAPPMSSQAESAPLTSLIQGGILLDTNVEVPFIHVGPEPAQEKPKRHIRLLRKLRFEEKPKRDPALRKIAEGLDKRVELHGKIDLLALRALDQANTLLDLRKQTKTSVSETNLSTPRASAVAKPLVMAKPESSTEYEDFSGPNTFMSTPPSHQDYSIAADPPARTASSYLFDIDPQNLSMTPSISTVCEDGSPPRRDPTMDTLDIDGFGLGSGYGSTLGLVQQPALNYDNDSPVIGPIPTAESSLMYDGEPMDWDRASVVSGFDLRRSYASRLPMTNSGMLDALDIENVSYHGSVSSLSTLSRPSFISARSERFSQPVPPPHIQTVNQEHREQEIYNEPSNVMFDDGSNISLLSELTSGYEMAPCEGFSPEIAAELAAIPDESFDSNNALAVAQAKLEGTWKVKRHLSSHMFPIGASLAKSTAGFPSFVSRDSHLYSQAFASKADLQEFLKRASISSLAIPFNDSLQESLVRDKESRMAAQTSLSQTIPSPRPNLLDDHAPFILSVSPQDLCKQFTIIERDALLQVDWKELIEVSWPSEEVAIDSWVWFVAEKTVRGAGVVSARFSLVVNWVKSEILLCRQASLKAQTISRFIHMACVCREMQNFATMFQIVLALTSEVVANKQSTAWSMVSSLDLDRLANLEKIVTPLRNFRNFRELHRRINYSKGVIPFAGIYLADLSYNNQKPNWIEGKINLPKFQTASSVVRSLLQCIEWTKNYELESQPKLLSKCLYLQALTPVEMEQLLPIS